MPKMKTHRSGAKRYHVTAPVTGRVWYHITAPLQKSGVTLLHHSRGEGRRTIRIVKLSNHKAGRGAVTKLLNRKNAIANSNCYCVKQFGLPAINEGGKR